MLKHVKLRPHHIESIQSYHFHIWWKLSANTILGVTHGRETQRNLLNIANNIGGDTLVEIIDGPDDICGPCPYEDYCEQLPIKIADKAKEANYPKWIQYMMRITKRVSKVIYNIKHEPGKRNHYKITIDDDHWLEMYNLKYGEKYKFSLLVRKSTYRNVLHRFLE